MNGKPQRLVKAAYFVVYPALMVGQLGLLCWLHHFAPLPRVLPLSVAGGPTASSRNSRLTFEDVVVKTASKLNFATDGAEAKESMVAGMVVTVIAQYYAAEIGSGACTKMPPMLPSALVLVAVLPLVARRSGRWLEHIFGRTLLK